MLAHGPDVEGEQGQEEPEERGSVCLAGCAIAEATEEAGSDEGQERFGGIVLASIPTLAASHPEAVNTA